jgi:hypothetical protein
MRNVAPLILLTVLIITNIGVRINLDKYEERKQIMCDSHYMKVLSREDNCLAGTSLHPLQSSELTTSLSPR